jgi:TetR/AcrR family transcriptional regulator
MSGVERRQQIIDGARVVFATGGVAAPGIREIAEGVGIDSALLYHYFSSKEEIFEAAVVEPLGELIVKIAGLAQSIHAGPPDEREQRVEEGLTAMVRLLKEALPLLGLGLFAGEEAGRRFFKSQIYPLLEHSYKAGLVSVEGWTEKPVHPLLGAATFGMCLGIAMQFHFMESDVDDAELGEVLKNYVLYGLL